MIRQKMDSLSFELLSRMAHMMTRMTRKTHWLDSHVLTHDSLARWLAGSQFVKTLMTTLLIKKSVVSCVRFTIVDVGTEPLFS